jgi:hypothetical protein
MGKEIATEKAKLKPNQDEWIMDPVLTGLGVQTVKAGGSPMLGTMLQVMCPSWKPGSGDTSPGVAAGPFVFTATGSNVSAGHKQVLLKGDKSAPVVVTWANTPPNVPPRVAPITLEIDDPGQTDVTGS